MSEKDSRLLYEIHDEVYAERFNEDKLHADNEWMINLIQDRLL